MRPAPCAGACLLFVLALPSARAAGDVSTVLSKGALVVRGDGLGNALEITQEEAGSYRITGLQGTTIDGQHSLVVLGVQGDVRVEGGDGDDTLRLIGCVLADDLRVMAGTGHDSVRLESLVVAGDVLVSGASGDDLIEVSACEVGGKMRLLGGSDDDFIGLGFGSCQQALQIKTGAGNDEVFFVVQSALQPTKVALGGGDDSLELLQSDFVLLRASGGGGEDSAANLGGNTFGEPSVLKSFESGSLLVPSGGSADSTST